MLFLLYITLCRRKDAVFTLLVPLRLGKSNYYSSPLVTLADQLQFVELMNSEQYLGVKTMSTTWFEQGIEQGEVSGQRKLVLKVLAKRFGSLSPESQQTVAIWPLESIEDLIDRAYKIDSLESL